MRKLASALLMALGWAVPLFAAPATMRVDYYHTGNDKEERLSLDRVVVEPLPWPGSPTKTIDATNLGKYFFEVVDVESGRVLYSRGFASIYGEWETTGEAQSMNRTFSESLRFPAVDKPARVSVKKRDQRNAFKDIWTFTLDPADKFIVRGAKAPAAGALIKLHDAGDPADKLDLLILGDGYTAAERGKFERDAKRLLQVFFSTSPFKERQRDINVWGLVPPAPQSGISRPSQHIHQRSPLGTSYDTFDSERYILTVENKAFRELASNAPYEVVEILTNSSTYGGGGIFNLYATVAADSAWAPYIFVHEFGHHIAGLADEYLHLRRRVSAGDRPGRTVGAERHGAARSGQSEVEGPRDAGDAAADSLAEGTVRKRHQGAPGAAPGNPFAESSGIRDERAVQRRDGARYGALERGAARREGGSVRRSQLRGQGLLPAAVRLHHVHPRCGAVLRGVPARDRDDT